MKPIGSAMTPSCSTMFFAAVVLRDYAPATRNFVLPRAHDCIGVLMGDRHRYAAYYENHPGVYYRSPRWVEFQTADLTLEPAFASQNRVLGEQCSLEEFINKYGDDNVHFLYEQFSSFRRRYSGLTYISTGITSDEASRKQARSEAVDRGWTFGEVVGSPTLLDRLVNGRWDPDDLLSVSPNSTIRASIGDVIMEAP